MSQGSSLWTPNQGSIVNVSVITEKSWMVSGLSCWTQGGEVKKHQ